MLETTFAAVSAERLHLACGQEPGWICRNVYDWTGNRTLAELADFIIGKPLSILAILICAWLANRIARRGVKGVLRTLRSGAVQERMGTLQRLPLDLAHTSRPIGTTVRRDWHPTATQLLFLGLLREVSQDAIQPEPAYSEIE